MPKRRPNRRSGKRRNTNNNSALITRDLDQQAARLQTSGTDSLTWNMFNDPVPRFGRSSAFDNKVHNVIQTSNVGSIGTATTSLGIFYGLAVTAATHVNQFSSWAAVFDQYRIQEIEAWVFPVQQTSGAYVNTSSFSTVTAVDYDNSTAPTGTAPLLQYSNAIVTPFSNGHYRKWRPHAASAVYGSGVFGQYSNVISPWIDCASSTAEHYGLKIATDSAPANNTYGLTLYLRIWVQFRNVF
jgi:hypothetical protein